ncbi:MAG: inorganic phosphate transporter, partial [Planctomycetaceae bacterium]
MTNGLLMLMAGFVAFTNGANANFKGVASLYGSGTTTRRMAILWGATTTFAGSIAAWFLAEEMLKNFSGRGIVPDTLARSPEFATAVGFGAAFTSFLATRLSFPVSTTHALVGALLGAGLAESWSNVRWAALGRNFIAPLVFSPLIAVIMGAAAYWILKHLRL